MAILLISKDLLHLISHLFIQLRLALHSCVAFAFPLPLKKIYNFILIYKPTSHVARTQSMLTTQPTSYL